MIGALTVGIAGVVVVSVWLVRWSRSGPVLPYDLGSAADASAATSDSRSGGTRFPASRASFAELAEDQQRSVDAAGCMAISSPGVREGGGFAAATLSVDGERMRSDGSGEPLTGGLAASAPRPTRC
jgi:hypothetical protein